MSGRARDPRRSSTTRSLKSVTKPGRCGNNGRPTRIAFVRWANVFNLDQTEGIKPSVIAVQESPTLPLERAVAIVENAKLCPIHHAGFSSYYSPQDDVIRVPSPSTFHSWED
jgi:antirestriction protein ArdC